MRQREEDDIVPAEDLRRALTQHAVGQRGKVRLELTQSSTRVAARRHRADLDIGVLQEEPQQLSPGVPAGSRHCDPYHADDYAAWCNLMQSGFRCDARRHGLRLAS